MDFLGRRLAARTLPPVTIRELRLALQDEWAAMPQQLIDTLILSMGRRCETCLANLRGGFPPIYQMILKESLGGCLISSKPVIPDFSLPVAVVLFLFLTGHDCLNAHLLKIRLKDTSADNSGESLCKDILTNALHYCLLTLLFLSSGKLD
ncbi:hypothetical protein TNCV_27731 [Trichonephila clavipes]|uniref:Uncharacterized protein n=1 Tax=Trichonephila clavipes TaxID=2585209 RepID=A0A8X6WK18_TRICX|nr:hypothetical protein TNCV_27731 [Trichonephila clavipes]